MFVPSFVVQVLQQTRFEIHQPVRFIQQSIYQPILKPACHPVQPQMQMPMQKPTQPPRWMSMPEPTLPARHMFMPESTQPPRRMSMPEPTEPPRQMPMQEQMQQPRQMPTQEPVARSIRFQQAVNPPAKQSKPMINQYYRKITYQRLQDTSMNTNTNRRRQTHFPLPYMKH